MYEYRVIKWSEYSNTPEDLELQLNAFGKEGWRLVKILPGSENMAGTIPESPELSDGVLILERDMKL